MGKEQIGGYNKAEPVREEQDPFLIARNYFDRRKLNEETRQCIITCGSLLNIAAGGAAYAISVYGPQIRELFN
jgi:hypothetical protein